MHDVDASAKPTRVPADVGSRHSTSLFVALLALLRRCDIDHSLLLC
jgi:hypothetical protein